MWCACVCVTFQPVGGAGGEKESPRRSNVEHNPVSEGVSEGFRVVVFIRFIIFHNAGHLTACA